MVEPELEIATEPKGPSISLSINNVVGNYKVQVKPKLEVTAATLKTTPKATVKPNSKPLSAKLPAKPLPKSNPKVNLNKTPVPAPQKTNASKNSATKQRRAMDEDEEDLDPSIYLDPTITITLVNNEPEKGKTSINDGAMSSSDLQVNKSSFNYPLLKSIFLFIGLECSGRKCVYYCRPEKEIQRCPF